MHEMVQQGWWLRGAVDLYCLECASHTARLPAWASEVNRPGARCEPRKRMSAPDGGGVSVRRCGFAWRSPRRWPVGRGTVRDGSSSDEPRSKQLRRTRDRLSESVCNPWTKIKGVACRGAADPCLTPSKNASSSMVVPSCRTCFSGLGRNSSAGMMEIRALLVCVWLDAHGALAVWRDRRTSVFAVKLSSNVCPLCFIASVA